MLTLVVNPGLPDEQLYPLASGTFTIGRTKDNDICFVHKSLSRTHARIELDGQKIVITDLQSKNGVFHKGRRVARAEVKEGEAFRCGDISFMVESATSRLPKMSVAAQTLPSPLAIEVAASRRITHIPQAVTVDDDTRYKDKLFVLIRASELLVSELSLEKFLDEIIVLAVQILEVDRIALLMLDEQSLEMQPRVLKQFIQASARPFSRRVVDWVTDHGTPASFADVSKDKSLPGDAKEDNQVKSALAVPVNPGGGTVGVLYADSLSMIDHFRPDDLALMRALANFAAIAIENDALRRTDRERSDQAQRSQR